MTTFTLKSALFAGALLIGTSGVALAQADANDHDVHHPEAGERTSPDAGANDNGEAPHGMSAMMDRMTPEMMQMMMKMMREGGMGSMMADGPMADGPMGGMMDGPMSDGMMGGMGDMPRGPMGGMGDMPRGPMGGMMDDMPMMQGHRGMRGHGIGPGALYGIPRGSVTEMTPARVETHLSDLLERHDNPRLELGEITEAEDGSIIAEIVTVDGALVQRLAFNRYPGIVRQID